LANRASGTIGGEKAMRAMLEWRWPERSGGRMRGARCRPLEKSQNKTAAILRPRRLILCPGTAGSLELTPIRVDRRAAFGQIRRRPAAFGNRRALAGPAGRSRLLPGRRHVVDHEDIDHAVKLAGLRLGL